MEGGAATSSSPQRPQHRRNASSKSNILKTLVSPKRPTEQESSSTSSKQKTKIQTVPLLPPDPPHSGKSKVLGERQHNSRSPSSSPSKSRQKNLTPSKTSIDIRTARSPSKTPQDESSGSPKKSKSSTNLSAMFAKKNRSNMELPKTVQKDKENTTPPSSSNGPIATPIWAQYASAVKPTSDLTTSDGKSSDDREDEIAKYTPREYSPSKQRNFNGTFEQPQLRPTLGARPQSMFITGKDIVGPIGRRMSGDKSNVAGRKSLDLERRWTRDNNLGRTFGDAVLSSKKDASTDRKTSGSSTEQPPAKEKLTIGKRGSRVMAAVAAFQGKTGKDQPVKEDPVLDPKAVDAAFEAVLDSRNIPEAMRHKMRSLTLRVKADFVKSDQEASRSPPGTADSNNSAASKQSAIPSPAEAKETEEDKSTKRSRARSRTFTFSKGDKRGGDSPTKKQRSHSKSRPDSGYDSPAKSPSKPTTPRTSMDGKRRSGAGPAIPADYISYLQKNQDPVKIEVGRLHKLRILLRNETVAWVDGFLSLGGMAEIVGLLHRIMAVEWREEHEDQLLHETLLCLKGLCTTERAMAELEKVADGIFPALVAMLFDEEKKGPAEYTTRGIVFAVLFNYLASATSTNSSSSVLESRARKILSYVSEPNPKPDDARPVEFVLGMRVPRPYKTWCREVSNVTKEVFWIFLHHMNIVPLPSSDDPINSTGAEVDPMERAKVLERTYMLRHFPGTRPPVPAAPYIGGVEWDATTYIASQLDLMNGLLASLPTVIERNKLRAEFRASGFEKVLGGTLRTCKEKFYSCVHDGLRAWVAAAAEDGWETIDVREGPSLEEQAQQARRSLSPKKSPKKKEAPPKLEAPIIEAPKLDFGIGNTLAGAGDDDGWLE